MRSSSKENVSRLRSSKTVGRRFLMWRRKMKYGMSNFVRNIWLSLAAIVVMSFTLLTVLVAAAATVVLNDTVEMTKVEKMNLVLYLRPDTPETIKDSLKKDLENDGNVSFVGIDMMAPDNEMVGDDVKSIIEDGGISIEDIFPIVATIHVYDVSQTGSLTEIVNGENSEYKEYLAGNLYDYQFFNENSQKTVQNMTELANGVQLVGLVLAGIFLFITILVIFNTIRLAIFARSDEIEMEKLIGAEKSYVRGPFLAEAEIYGIISGIISVVVGYALIIGFLPAVLTGEIIGGVSTALLHAVMIDWAAAVVIGTILLGVLIGNLSARLAVRKYLRY